MTAWYQRGTLAVAGLCAVASFLRAQTGTPLQIVTDSLPSATVGTAYYQQLITTGGLCANRGSAASRIDAGALPPGLAITSPTASEAWILQGVPYAAGTFTFTVHLIWTYQRFSAADSNCVDEAVKSLTLVVQGTGGTQPPPGSTTLAVDRTSLSVAYHTGQFPPAADNIHLTASGGVAVAFTLQSITDNGVPWLSATAPTTTTPAVLTVNYPVSGLVAGTYTGRIVVSTGGQAALTIPVTLIVVTDTSVQFQTSPSSLAFSMVTGAADPPAKTLAVTVAGSNVIFQVAVSSPPNGKWLTVAPTASATPSTLTVTVLSKDLAVGTYNGSLTLSVAGVPNSTLAIPVTFAIAAPVPKPTIATGGIINAAGAGNAIAPGAWVSIFGTSLSATTRAWRTSDLQGGLPTSLDGVGVTIDGKPAVVAFISPTQLNVLAADDTVTGLVQVVVKNTLGTSDSVLALQQTAAPALFQFPGSPYAAATHADGSSIAGPRLVLQGIPGTVATAGETIVLYGTGFGATLPAISATAPVTAPLPLANPQDLHIRIGGLDSAIAYAGLISPGLYQFNVVVPQVADGDQPVVTELRGLLSQAGALIAIGH